MIREISDFRAEDNDVLAFAIYNVMIENVELLYADAITFEAFEMRQRSIWRETENAGNSVKSLVLARIRAGIAEGAR